MRVMIAVLCLSMMTGCSPIDPLIIPPSGRPLPQAQFQVWTGDSVYLVQQVSIIHDTLRGVMLDVRPRDAHQVVLPVGAIDSVWARDMREGGPNVGLTIWGIVMAALTAAFVFVRGS